MESSESHEPSYYEVALTNRQVLIAFVALLVCLVVAFLSGVWIGRGDLSRQAEFPAASEPAPGSDPPLEQLSFFNGRDAGARAAAPSPATTPPAKAAPTSAAAGAVPTREDPSGGETMRQNLEATIAANRAPAPAGTRQTVADTPPAPVAGPAAKPAATTPVPAKPTPAVAAGKLFVQVYSSTNGGRAKEIVAQLQRAGFVVQLAESTKAGATQFRVRVGPYENRAKADAAAARLRREFRLDTWITDTP